MVNQIRFVRGTVDDRRTKDTGKRSLAPSYSLSQQTRTELLNEVTGRDGDDDAETEDVLQKRMRTRTLVSREDKYHRRRLDRVLVEGSKVNNTNDTLKRPKTGSEEEEDKEVGPGKFEKTRGIVYKRSKPGLETKGDSYRPPETLSETGDELKHIIQASGIQDLRYFKESDRLHFGLVLDEKPLDELNEYDRKKKIFLTMLLKVKNGTPAVRKYSMKQLTKKCTEFDPKLMFDCLLPILLDRSLEDQERYLMIKIIDKILYRLGELVRPYAKSILVVVAPLLIDEDPIARGIGRDIISNLAGATGLATILLALRPDIENDDEYIRNTTSRVLAVVGSALGPYQLLPFINAACHSRKSWKARHTGVKIVQQLAIILNNGVLQYLDKLVHCIKDGLMDEHIPVRIITANTLATLAQKSYPYGIEAFNIVLEPLWRGLRTYRGKVLASFLRCFASFVPLMDPEYSAFYTKELIRIVRKELNSPDDDMRRAVLFFLQKCSKVDAITPSFLKEEIVPAFFENFWVRRVALDIQFNKMVTYTTMLLSEKLGCAYVIEKLLDPLRDESEPFRIMAIHAIQKVAGLLGTTELDERLETRLIDSLLIAFQEQQKNDPIIFKGFGTVATSLGTRMKPFLPPTVSTILNQLRHGDKQVRQNAADLCNILIPVIKDCGEFDVINKLNIILYESLGEVYPEVLGSIICVMDTILSVMDLTKLQPQLNQILPSLTPILRNTHKKVQFNTIKFIGHAAVKGPSYVPPKEWMRICMELLEILKSTSKRIRIAANASFGHIAKALGPHNVLVVLLNNLKVQERQLRVCTAVAIGIVAETCGPYTVLPALMNEYKTPETNVQNGVLKAMTFMFEYIGDLSQDYVYFITPLLEDALTDRDLVHRQTAATVIKHLALYCTEGGCEDAFIHLLNLLMPNIFETSPHAIARVIDGLEALSYAIGPGVFMNYIWAGLFHPARNVRRAFWKVYNNVYIQHTDALVPHYPITLRESTRIEELELVL